MLPLQPISLTCFLVGIFLLNGCGDNPTAAQADTNIRLGPDGIVERDKDKPFSTEARAAFREILREKGVPLDDVRQICFYAEMFAFALVKPEKDITTYGMDEFWAGPEMSLKTGKADCEDHSMLFALLVADLKSRRQLSRLMLFLKATALCLLGTLVICFLKYKKARRLANLHPKMDALVLPGSIVLLMPTDLH